MHPTPAYHVCQSNKVLGPQMYCTATPGHKRNTAYRYSRLCGIFLTTTLLAGCAAAHIQDPVFTRTVAVTPTEILVRAQSPSGQDVPPELRECAAVLQAKLLTRLEKAHIASAAYHHGTAAPGAVLLRVRITKADPGTTWERVLIGFGAGRAKLQVQVQLQSADGKTPMTSFDTRSDSGRMPGFIMPGGMAAATQSVVPLIVGGGIKLITTDKDGLNRPLDKTADAIISELKKYYISAGWKWPAKNASSENGK